MLTESQGCAVLKESFQAAGYDIHDNFAFSEGIIRFHIDGFDPQARVGFEFITTEAGDRVEISAEMIGQIEARIAQGELFVLLVDEYEVESAEELRLHAERFLEQVALRRRNGQKV